jgi:hypothetical protein
VADARGAVGVKTQVPVEGDQVTFAGTLAPVESTLRVNVVAPIPVMVSEKPIASAVEVETPVAFGATFQVCKSGRIPVKNVQLVAAKGFPARSRIAVAPPPTRTVYHVSSAIGDSGTSLHTRPRSDETTAGVTAPVTLFVNVKVDAFTPVTTSLNVTWAIVQGSTAVDEGTGH